VDVTISSSPVWLREVAAKKGWTLINPDYRLIPEATIDELLSDAKDAWTFVHTKLNAQLKTLNLPPVDLDHVVTGGASAGGYLAMQSGHLFNPRPKAIATIYGYGFDHPTFYSVPRAPDDSMGGKPFTEALALEEKWEKLLKTKVETAAIESEPVVTPWGSRGMLLQYLVATGKYFETVFGHPAVSSDPKISYLWPSQSVDEKYPPIFLSHGELDSVCPASESELIAQKAKDKGVVSEVIVVKGEEHLLDLFDNPNGAETREKVVAWYEKYA